MYLLAPSTLRNFKKNFRVDPELWGCAIFEAQNGPIVMHKFFFGKNHYYYFHLSYYYFHLWAQNGPFGPNKNFVGKFLISFSSISPLHCAKFLKNSSSRSRVMRMHNFWAQNGPFPQMRIFFRKPVNEPRFFHSCLSTCQKSKSDINLLVKYWRLKNTEISLAESHFWL